MNNDKKFKLIITIVDKGMAPNVIAASKEGGAEGGTVINGRGSSIYEKGKIFGFPIEPEKEIIMIVVEQEKEKFVIDEITSKLNIKEKGKGITFVLDVENVIGI